MKRIAFITILCTLILMACSSDDSGTTVTPPPGPTIDERLQTIMDSKVGPDKLVGAAVSVRINGCLLYTSDAADD